MIYQDTTAEIQSSLTLLVQLLGMRTVLVSEIVDDMLHVRIAVDKGGSGVTAGTSLRLDETLCRYVNTNEGFVSISDTAHDPHIRKLVARQGFPIGSYIGVPIHRADGSLYGTLCALDPEPQKPSKDDLALLHIIARHISGIIATSSLHDTATQPTRATCSDTGMTREALDPQTILLQTIAHDVRAPLMTIYGYVDLLKEDWENLTDNQHEALEHIQQASHFINRLMNDLLDSSSLKHQLYTLTIKEFDIVDLAHTIAAALRPRAEKRGLLLTVKDAGTLPPISGDPDRFQQILINLLNNAISYTPQGWIQVVIEMHTESEVEIRVEDSGIGIAPHIQAEIWQRHNRATTLDRGFGLGLYIVQQLVHAMGGTLGLESVVGAGSTFWIRLPIHGPPSIDTEHNNHSTR